MAAVTAAAFLHLCLCATAVVSDTGPTDTAVAATPGDVVILPCYTDGDVTPTLTTWEKDGREVARGDAFSPSPPPAGRRVAVTSDGSLNFGGVARGDEGAYLCSSTLPGNNVFHARVSLQVTSGPDNVSASISPATALANGSLVVVRGSSVSLRCSGSSYPAQQLTWSFRGAAAVDRSLASSSGPRLDFSIQHVQPAAQGLYSCTARNPASGQEVNTSTQLLVYYVPDRHPECMWAPAQDPSHTQFNCSWLGAYPPPTLRWLGGEGSQGGVYASDSTESLSVTLNRSVLADGQTLRCAARHQALAPGTAPSCSFTLKSPYPEGEPLVTALEATSVTLTCIEAASLPPASTTWRRGLGQDAVVAGQKYVLWEDGAALKLQILNVSRADEGVYFCRAENLLAVRELEVYLTVRTSSPYTGVILGIFIAALIVGLVVIVAKTLYVQRHRFCLGDGFGRMEEDQGDVLSLVESDDDQVFQDAVPRLAPLANQTTLVQIHQIPSNDHEDAETDTSLQGDTVLEEEEEGEEPVDLVTF
ncbi:V-set and immunoglobulin domain-containing protein 10 [Pseudoliparis swirei]|uniref:V-set and immunoglobulin domain-containing protein 10 n=1 Tax=Pseudoliparis swirei TaxID=2059687 RepID=UPI0024BEEABA|nr:V-set and immunoglobulin domain-containing protein 10 [Pseudoliparis swirei]